MTRNIKLSQPHLSPVPSAVMDVREQGLPGMLLKIVNSGTAWISYMSTLKKVLKSGLVGIACVLGLCALAKRLDISSRITTIAHSMEAVPFPGTGLYTFLASRQLRPLYAAIAEEIVESDRTTRVLDLGTGPGYLPIEIALRNPDILISGLDESADMVQIAEADARAAHVSKSIEFVTGNPTNLPYPGRYFDLAVSVNVLHHWKDPLTVFDEVFHVLEPGGQFWVYDYRKEVSPEVWKSLSNDLPLTLRMALFLGPVASSRLSYGMEDMLKMAGQTHFKIAAFERLTLPLFGRPMPVFNLLRLNKPDTPQGEDSDQ